MKERPTEGKLEQWGRAIVSQHLGVPVDRGDDGRRNAQPDGLVRDPSGTFPLEIVSDTDGRFEAQDKLLKQHSYSFKAPGDPGTIIWVTSKTDIRRLRKLLLELLPTLVFDEAEILWGGDIPDALLRADVKGVQRIDGRAEQVLILHEGWNSWDDDIDFVGWVLRVLAQNPDVEEKLKAYGGQRQHALIWARPSSAWSAGTMLRDHDVWDLPAQNPQLPGHLTDLWVASTYRPSVLHWSREAGWHRLSRKGIAGVG